MGVDLIGAGIGTRRAIPFVNGKRTGDSLGIGFKDGLAAAEPEIELTGKRYWADLDAVATGRAFIQFDKAGFLTDRYLEIAFFTGDTFKLSLGDKVNIDMLADLDQFG